MDRWIGKVAVVTGASSGIGEAVAIALVEHGLKVVALARRLDNMRRTADGLKSASGTFYPVQCDVTKEEDILKAFQFAKSIGGVDILVNNAGICYNEPIIDGTTENFKTTLDVNILAAAICSREASRSMRERKTDGHIIMINSVLGHNASSIRAPLSLYQASKYALRATAEVVRNELSLANATVKVTNISPGLVKTEMPVSMSPIDEKIFEIYPYLESKDIADAVLYVLGTPPNVQVKELTITPLNSDILSFDYIPKD